VAEETRCALGIDIGGTHYRAGVVTADGQVVELCEPRTSAGGEPDVLAREIRGPVDALIAGREVVNAVGVCLPGIWDRETTVMQRALNLPRLEGVNLRELFEGALGRTVVLETDVNAAGWAQWRHFSPRPARFVYLSVGTGIGGCVILGGEVVRHTRGGAGHFGHLVVDTSATAPACRCGARGCLEVVAGGAALNRLLYDEFKHSRRAGGVPEHDVLSRAARALAVGALQIANIYAPDVVALGGGVIDANEELVGQVSKRLGELGCTLVPEAMRIEHAPLYTDEAGVIGAALLALAT